MRPVLAVLAPLLLVPSVAWMAAQGPGGGALGAFVLLVGMLAVLGIVEGIAKGTGPMTRKLRGRPR